VPVATAAIPQCRVIGVRVCLPKISISRNCAAVLQDFVAVLRDRVAAAAVKHMDETGLRIAGRTRWLHAAATVLLTFYRVCHKRGSLLANVVGTVVTTIGSPIILCRACFMRCATPITCANSSP
jgi:hypothetical protein